MAKPIDHLAIIGGGLMGSSVARAVRRSGAAVRITLSDSNLDHLARLEALSLGDAVFPDPCEAVDGADVILFATPPASIGDLVAKVATSLKPGAILTDVGSVKAAIGNAMREAAPVGVHIVPGHPVAGAETSGPDAGYGNMFENRWTILTPSDSQQPDYLAAVQTISDLWTALGANVEIMDERHHDLVLAITSHLPHLIAYNIVGTAADLEEVTESEVIKFSAGGFRDFTRIAASDPTMWRDVFLLNREAVLEMLGRFTEDLQALSRAIRWGEGDDLHAFFSRTRAIRRGIIDAGQDSAEPDFGRRGGAKD
jgi:cyclohexadieny/prephenate dehydrogenase